MKRPRYDSASSRSCVEALIAQQREQYNWQSILLGANIGAVHVGNRIWVPQTMAMTYNADDVVAARAGRNSPNTRRRSRHVGLRHYPDSVVMSLELLSSADAPWTFISPLAFRASPV